MMISIQQSFVTFLLIQFGFLGHERREETEKQPNKHPKTDRRRDEGTKETGRICQQEK